MISAAVVELCSKVVLFVVSPATFLALFFVTAPFGRHEEGASWLWGFRMNPKLAWVLMEIPNLVAVPIFALGPRSGSLLNAFLLSLFVLHYVNRAIIYPLRAKLAKPMPVSMFAMSAAWTTFNGVMHGVWLGWHATFEAGWSSDPRFLAGLVLFFGGLYVNWESDEILRNLRGPRQTGYFIPQGSLFDWVSASNYFGETVEWAGFALAMGGAWVSLAFAAFTFANLSPRAWATHKWYQNKFGAKYPAERKAFFPYLF